VTGMVGSGDGLGVGEGDGLEVGEGSGAADGDDAACADGVSAGVGVARGVGPPSGDSSAAGPATAVGEMDGTGVSEGEDDGAGVPGVVAAARGDGRTAAESPGAVTAGAGASTRVTLADGRGGRSPDCVTATSADPTVAAVAAISTAVLTDAGSPSAAPMPLPAAAARGGAHAATGGTTSGAGGTTSGAGGTTSGAGGSVSPGGKGRSGSATRLPAERGSGRPTAAQRSLYLARKALRARASSTSTDPGVRPRQSATSTSERPWTSLRRRAARCRRVRSPIVASSSRRSSDCS